MTPPPHLSGLTGSFGKNLASEQKLFELNELLAPIETQLTATFETPQRPLVFVIGAPRSGTTLMSQILAATEKFGGATNFMARFWKAPTLAMRMQEVLDLPSSHRSFRSVRGATDGISEPHEFGYYWSSWFDLGQETHSLSREHLARVDLLGLKRSLASMEAAAQKPLMFKNNTWFTFQASWLAEQFPTSVFVACVRDPFFVAQSIYAQRLALGDLGRWWSVRPSTYATLKGLSPLEQVAAQAVDITLEMQKALALVPGERLIRASYRKLCEEPRRLAEEVLQACAAIDGNMTPSVENVPERFETTDRIRLDPTDAEALQHLVAERLAGT